MQEMELDWLRSVLQLYVNNGLYILRNKKFKKKESRSRAGAAQRVPGDLGSHIS
jgi:hypothetical protein